MLLQPQVWSQPVQLLVTLLSCCLLLLSLTAVCCCCLLLCLLFCALGVLHLCCCAAQGALARYVQQRRCGACTLFVSAICTSDAVALGSHNDPASQNHCGTYDHGPDKTVLGLHTSNTIISGSARLCPVLLLGLRELAVTSEGQLLGCWCCRSTHQATPRQG
jgi:hypothetical protein